jgi:hypothetical protein
MLPSLIIASLLAVSPAQCPNGRCGRPAVSAAPAKAWYRLAAYPGWLGYGALNAQGQIVVEQYAPEVVSRPAASPCSTGRCPRR